MKHVVNVGTDVATLCFFDAAALPAEIDEQLKKAHAATRDALAEQGRVGWIDYDSDGGYVMHFYVDEPVPDSFRPHLVESHACDRFEVPSGTLWACGAEYLAKDPARGVRAKRGLDRYPHMGAKFAVPPGAYAMKSWCVEWPAETEERSVEAAIGDEHARSWRRQNMMMGYLILAAVALGVCLAFSTATSLTRTGQIPSWHLWGWPLLALLIGMAVHLGRKLARSKAAGAATEIAKEFPSFVVHLERWK